MQRVFSNLIVQDPAVSAAFYQRLFEAYRPTFKSDWFVQLASTETPALELGLMRRDHPLVPEAARGPTGGVMVTIVVDDVDAFAEKAQGLGVQIVEPPRDLFYGQRRILIADPDGHLVDVSSECPPDPEWMKRVRPMDGGGYEEA